MIEMSELLKNNRLADQSHDIQDNLEELLEKINQVRVAWGNPMTVTSGLRSLEEHLAIYAKKGITDKNKIPMQSKHLYGLAVDIYDPNAELHGWCKKNEDLLINIGIWLENRQGSWQHFQIRPFGSYQLGGTIWFNP